MWEARGLINKGDFGLVDPALLTTTDTLVHLHRP
jgi:hypothetical protein